MTTTTNPSAHYLAPDRLTRRVMNPTIAWLTRRGVSMWGSRVLEVPGRRSGVVRSTPVNVLTVDGVDFLVAPRGTTEWVRNVRAAGGCTLRLGRHRTEVRAVEVDDADKVDILRPYLQRWKWEVGQFFDGVGPESDDAALLAAAPRHPVFRLMPV